MITDPSIREQGYLYFLSEAPELLQTIEQELFHLSSNRTTAVVHNLMRATHTIKGGAANVGLEVINKVAHSLEDVFKALYNPDVPVDAELMTLLFQAYECLQLPLTAQMNNSSINDDEILQRAASIFAKLQEKLGDAFGAENHIPTSTELGFDIVLSIFEVGVSQRIDSIVEAIQNNLDARELADFLRSQAEVFIGLGESLNLPGLGALAQTVVTALDTNPEHTAQIAKIFLTDLQKAREDVLAGDRSQGGKASPTLQKFTQAGAVDTIHDGLVEVISESPVENAEEYDLNSTLGLSLDLSSNLEQDLPITLAQPPDASLRNEIELYYQFLTAHNNSKNQPLNPVAAKVYLKVIRYIFGWFNHYRNIPQHNFSLSLLITDPFGETSVTYIENWLNDFLGFVEEEQDTPSLCTYRKGLILSIILRVVQYLEYQEKRSYFAVTDGLENQIKELAKAYKKYPPITASEKNWTEALKLQELLVIKDNYQPVHSVSTESFLLETIWGESNIDIPKESEKFNPIATEYLEVKSNNNSANFESISIIDKSVSNEDDTLIEIVNAETDKINLKPEAKPEPLPAKNPRQTSFVRVEVESLQRLNYLAGELLIHQKRRSLYDEQLKEVIGLLNQQILRHQASLNKLRDTPLVTQNFASQNIQNVASVNFDSLEMDEYSEFNLQFHEILEETLQLQETVESLDLVLSQCNQIADKKQRLVIDIIDNLVEARMLPLGNILNRFPHMVQNLGNLYGKNVSMKLMGGEVLVDKAIAEKLYDPLLHLVRNAFDHGIESSENRRQQGKSSEGIIEICAYNQGSQTIIEVSDDGQGLNFDKIHNKAIELGLLPPVESGSGYYLKPTEAELVELLFSPGFSTAGKVSEISGRGIGLDIVRSQLEALNGSISVKSIPNKGTTFILKIPFSMTTDKLMLVQAGGVVYALLLDSIEKILIPITEQIKEFEGRKVLHWNTGKEERMVSLRKLSDLVQYNGSFMNGAILNYGDRINVTNPLLLLRRDKDFFGLEVDQILGEQELVIRPLGNAITPPNYVYGCSSLANGNMILVIDGTLLLSTIEMKASIDVMALPAFPQRKVLQMSGADIETLPMLAPTETENTSGHELTSAHSKSSKVVLVVDDAISLRQTLTLTLQKYGYQVLQAQNGVEALETLQRHPEIEIVISDLEMPRMNGFELLTNVRQSQNLSKKPVVILTSRSAEKHRKLAEALGASAYLTKPYLENEFLSTVENLVSRKVDDLTQFVLRNS